MRKSLSKLIADNLSYYTNNTEKRCRSMSKGCFYSGKVAGIKTQGCFIGRQLSPTDRVKADKYFSAIDENKSIDNDSSLAPLIAYEAEIGIKIPKVIKDNEELMGQMQNLHDANINWHFDGLSPKGKATLNVIIKKFKLVKKDFKDMLK